MTSSRDHFAAVAVIHPWSAAQDDPLPEPAHGLVFHYRRGVHAGAVDEDHFVDQAAEDIWAAMLASITPCRLCPQIDWGQRGPAEYVLVPFTIT